MKVNVYFLHNISTFLSNGFETLKQKAQFESSGQQFLLTDMRGAQVVQYVITVNPCLY